MSEAELSRVTWQDCELVSGQATKGATWQRMAARRSAYALSVSEELLATTVSYSYIVFDVQAAVFNQIHQSCCAVIDPKGVCLYDKRGIGNVIQEPNDMTPAPEDSINSNMQL